MARKQIFAGNWKMHNTLAESRDLAEGVIKGLGDLKGREVVFFPSTLHVPEIINIAKNSPVKVGVQNMYYEEQGAFTGENSPVMVKDIGCDYILIGHSERRHVFGETDEMVNSKVKAAYAHGLVPMICVGELLEEREADKSEQVVDSQLRGAFKDISEEQAQKAVVAYEPVWAIGTGKVATPEIAESMHQHVRKVLAEIYSEGTADSIPVLYGGSVKPDNVEGLYAKENIDGALVGGASLKVQSFLDIISVG